MMQPMVRETREERELREGGACGLSGWLLERRMQAVALIVLAALVLLVTILRTGIHNVFLPGWWRLW